MSNNPNTDITIDERNDEFYRYQLSRFQAYRDGFKILLSADNCVEAHALCQVLLRYDNETENNGTFCLKNLQENYGSIITRTQLVKHLTVVEDYFHVGNHYMSGMFDLMLARSDDEYLKTLFAYYIKHPQGNYESNIGHSLFYGDALENKAPKKELIALEEKLFDYKPDASVLDPCSGYAFWINDIFREDNGGSNTPLLYLQDKDPIALGMACANSIIYRSRLGGASCDDSLKKIFQNQLTFDYVFINRRFTYTDSMTFSSIDDLDSLDIVNFELAEAGETIPFALALKHLHHDGQAAILCSTSTLYKKSSKVLTARTNLVHKNCIKAVIQLPAFFVKSVAEALVIIGSLDVKHPYVDFFYKPGTEPTVRMIDGAAYAKWYNATDADEHFIDTLVDLYRHGRTDRSGAEAFVKDVPLPEITSSSYNLSPAYYIDDSTENPEYNSASLTEKTAQLIANNEELIQNITESHQAFQKKAAELNKSTKNNVITEAL